MTLRAIAVDDEPLALEVIKRFAGKIPSLDLQEVFQSPIDAVAYMQEHTVDLIFLDIQMPDLTGMQFLQSIPERPMIIFTTAYSEYAANSYELNAVDYLLKPIVFDRFFMAVNKALNQQKAQEALDNQGNSNEKDFLFIKSDTRFFKVNLSEILYIEGMRDYIAVHTSRQRILTLMSMTNMLKKLPSDRFMRVHKSYIIGLDHIKLIQQNRVILKEVDKEIPISSSYKEMLIKLVEGQNE